MKSKQVFRYMVMMVSLLALSLSTGCGGETVIDTGMPDMSVGRWGHSATMLSDGRVLVAGGDTKYSTRTDAAEIYDPSGGSVAINPMSERRGQGHSATLLTNGKVLIVGHETVSEIFNPADNTWTPTPAMEKPRVWHVAILLPDGRVLIAGGQNADSRREMATAEIYDPQTGEWSRTGDMNVASERPSATLLNDGKVFLVGRNIGEVYDPATGIWTASGKPTESRWGGSTATTLSDGRVLVTGGEVLPGSQGNNPSSYKTISGVNASHDKNAIPTGKADFWDPSTNLFSAAPPMSDTRKYHQAVVMPDGKVLVIANHATEMFDMASNAWVPAPLLIKPRNWGASATLLSDGKVLVMGGVEGVGSAMVPTFSDMVALNAVEIFDPYGPME